MFILDMLALKIAEDDTLVGTFNHLTNHAQYLQSILKTKVPRFVYFFYSEGSYTYND